MGKEMLKRDVLFGAGALALAGRSAVAGEVDLARGRTGRPEKENSYDAQRSEGRASAP